MKQGQDEFFAVIGEGAALLGNLDAKSSGFFSSLDRLREILAILGYQSATKPIAYSLADKEASAKALWDYLGNGFKLLPDEVAVFEAKSVQTLAELIDQPSLAREASRLAGAGGGHPDSDESKIAVFKRYAGQGVDHGIPQHVLEASFAEVAALMKEKASDTPEYKEAQTAYEYFDTLEGNAAVNEADSATHVAATAYKSMRAQGASEAEVDAARDVWLGAMKAADDARTERYNKQNAAYAVLREISQKFSMDRAEKVRQLIEAKGKTIIAKVLEKSPITPEQATAWANEQIIDDNARKKLKKDGYDPDQVRRDMAEYFRITGGKASTIRLSLDGGKRANAEGITTRTGEKVINLGSGFDKVTLWHELAHHLEGDPIARGASNGFLLKRRESEKRYTLRSLTGHKGYRSDEIAYKDHFMSDYIGKIYQDGITEVFSMGVQYLSNPKDAAKLAAKDPEMFAMITGYLTAETTPAQAAKLAMHKGVIGSKAQENEDLATKYERAVQYLADKSPLTKDDWFESLDRQSINGQIVEKCLEYFKGKYTYVGSNGTFKVFAGVLRNRYTGRNAKGQMILDGDPLGSDTGPQTLISHVGIEGAQAIITIARRDNSSLATAWRAYFFDDRIMSKEQKLIETVGPENVA